MEKSQQVQPEPRTYGQILRLGELLQLQDPLSPGAEHDELQYVVIHQCSELWFKLMLHELDRVTAELQFGDLRLAARLLRRCGQIVRALDAGFALMETMTAYDYARFRPSLTGGSGFQSAQFRELEIALGTHHEGAVNQAAFTGAERERIERRLRQPSLWDAFVLALRRSGLEMPDREEMRANQVSEKRGLAILRDLYGGDQHPELREVSEELTALDNGILLWRTHHAVMAERAIGARVGTGGEGVEYLYRTARTRAFPELLTMRSHL